MKLDVIVNAFIPYILTFNHSLQILFQLLKIQIILFFSHNPAGIGLQQLAHLIYIHISDIIQPQHAVENLCNTSAFRLCYKGAFTVLLHNQLSFLKQFQRFSHDITADSEFQCQLLLTWKPFPLPQRITQNHVLHTVSHCLI